MEKIVCFINLFTAESKAYRIDQDNNQELITTIPVEQLTEGLATISSHSGIYNITLIGAPDYAEGLIPGILEYAKTNFNNNDLIVEVMR